MITVAITIVIWCQIMTKLGSLDLSHNLQANYAIIFLFRLDLIFHAYVAHIRCDSFNILNFASKQGQIQKSVTSQTVSHYSTFFF